MVAGLIVSAALILGLVAIVVFAIRDKRLYITTAFDLRTLPHGDPFTLDDGTTRLFSIVDAQIAFAGYGKLGKDRRRWFTSMSDFIFYVAQYEPGLLDTLRARVVDPAEYELDRSGWEDEDEHDNR